MNKSKSEAKKISQIEEISFSKNTMDISNKIEKKGSNNSKIKNIMCLSLHNLPAKETDNNKCKNQSSLNEIKENDSGIKNKFDLFRQYYQELFKELKI